MNKKEKYYNFIIDDLVMNTEILKIAYFPQTMNMIQVPFTKLQYAEIRMFDFRMFKDFLISKYGTSGEEVKKL